MTMNYAEVQSPQPDSSDVLYRSGHYIWRPQMTEKWHSVPNENAVISPRTVLVVDDYEPFRRFATATLRGQPNFLILGQAQDGLEAIRQADALKPDLILLDIGLPNMNGFRGRS